MVLQFKRWVATMVVDGQIKPLEIHCVYDENTAIDEIKKRINVDVEVIKRISKNKKRERLFFAAKINGEIKVLAEMCRQIIK